MVLDTGAVTRGSGTKHADRECNIRRWFVEQDLIDGMILLPGNLFYNTSAAEIIVVLSKHKPERRQSHIVFVNASRRVDKGRPKNYIPKEEIRPMAEMLLKGEPVEGEVAVITREQAAKADYNLSPSRWVRQADEIAHHPISEIVADKQRLDDEACKIDGYLATMLAKLTRFWRCEGGRYGRNTRDSQDYQSGRAGPVLGRLVSG